ncbi:MAG: ribosome maturation factor RimM [bacterium]
MREDMVAIGKIVAVQGNKGEVRLNPWTDDPRRFENLAGLYLIDKGGYPDYREIVGIRYRRNQVILRFERCDSINEAKELVGVTVYIKKEDRPVLDEDTFFISDILGIDVFTDQGDYLGKVTNCIETGANDVYEISGQLLIPATREVVRAVDLERRRMVIHLLEGLI